MENGAVIEEAASTTLGVGSSALTTVQEVNAMLADMTKSVEEWDDRPLSEDLAKLKKLALKKRIKESPFRFDITIIFQRIRLQRGEAQKRAADAEGWAKEAEERAKVSLSPNPKLTQSK
ncbi:hypothetical protein PENTCL1PPCAC_19807 [Pristionchus entomophagus]|uniref:Uncharacterized protein n=1 Tax=Pristionchus entomophagus TaxID=358040 RepID=A0AAV5TT57_9BILA|nr:hypothetical protein PENTCL1PPCAC_19807 [Pristionchus entomophagus]